MTKLVERRGALTWSRQILLAAVFLITLVGIPPSAGAALFIGTSGQGAGQWSNPSDLAVDEESGLLYLADNGNNRIDVFNASNGEFLRAFGWGVADGSTAALQTCVSTCFKGLPGGGAGQLDHPLKIAVDNDPASPAQHAIYVFDSVSDRVQRFTPAGELVASFGSSGDGAGQFEDLKGLAVGPAGIVNVLDVKDVGSCPFGEREYLKRIQKFSPTGTLEGAPIALPGTPCGDVITMAVDSVDAIYLASGGVAGAVRKYNPDGTIVGSPYPINASFNITAIEVDQSDNLLVGDNSNVTKILEYSDTGVLKRVLYGSPDYRLGGAVRGLAPLPSGGDGAFVIDESGQRVAAYTFPPAGPVIYPSSTFADPGSTKAVLRSRINPEGKQTSLHFEYVDQEEFEANGFSGGGVVQTPEVPVGSDFTLHGVEATVTGLTPETTYYFRAIPSNADAPGGAPGAAEVFETEPPITFGSIWVTSVGTDSALLHAEVNPHELPAEGYFQIVDDVTFQASGFSEAENVPLGEKIDFGADVGFVDKSTTAAGLQPRTLYHYRLIGEDHCKPAEPLIVCTFTGPASAFVTLDSAVTAPCPSNPVPRSEESRFLPDCRAYEMVSPVDKHGTSIETVFNDQNYRTGLDQAGIDGNRLTFSAYRAFAEPVAGPYVSQYMADRVDGIGWSTRAISPPREGPTLLLVRLSFDRQFKVFSPNLCEGWLVQDAAPVLTPDGIEGYSGLYRRDLCGSEGYEALSRLVPPLTQPVNPSSRTFLPEIQGVSADGSISIFKLADNLTNQAPAQPKSCVNKGQGCIARLYRASGGGLDLVCILPNGEPAEDACSLGSPTSVPGERHESVARAMSADGSIAFFSTYSNPEIPGPGRLFVRVDSTDTDEIASGPAQFWTAAVDGSRAIYSAEGALREYNVDSEASTQIAAGPVTGVAGASDDASRIYFVSPKAQAPGASEGQPNLYLYEAKSGLRFIATLASEDVTGGGPSPVSRFPINRTSRVTPDGQRIVFVSKASLTGYDNLDAVSREPDNEVYLYDASANGSDGVLLCISCNPTDARPQGRSIGISAVFGQWTAGLIPTWTTQLYPPRVVSDDGARVFFNSFDRLVARDTNGKADVYQWERAGSGDCEVSGFGYSDQAQGCISLISSGQSPQDSELVDSTPSGKDVFFKTYSSLVPQDPSHVDIYDARINGGFPIPEEENEECQEESCLGAVQPEATPPNPQSSAFVGPGDPVAAPTKPKRCPKGRHKVKRKGKVRCVGKHKKKGGGAR